jgi:hypothetical protein
VLTGGGLPRWLSWVALLAVVAVVAAVVVTHLPDLHGRPAAAGSSRPDHVAPAPAPNHGANEVLGVASRAHGAWILTGSELSRVDGTRVIRSVPLGGDVRLPSDSRPRLAVDAEAGRIWVVVAEAAPSELVEYDLESLQRVRRVVWPDLVHGAVAYRGHLYLATDLGMADLPPSRRSPKLVAGLGAASGPIALDAARHRIIVMNLGYPTLVWTYRPGQYPIRAGVELGMGGGTVAVVGDAIWVGGFNDRTAVLTRLDPLTLRPVRRGAVDLYGPGAVIDGAGQSVFWVRPGNGTDLLTCVNALTGRVEQQWHLPQVEAVASDRGSALVATRRGVVGLVLSGCSG